jgi:dTDP-4-dehydrorhamnose reductase
LTPVVVLGAEGALGRALIDQLQASPDYKLVAAPTHEQCDVRDESAVWAVCARLSPMIVFNAAAYTDVDRCEKMSHLAFAVNAVGAGNVARVAGTVGAIVVHYSTNFVFDGEHERPYREDDPVSPQSVYALSKLEGDKQVAAVPHHFILRTGTLYGRGGRNFPSMLMRRLRAGEGIRADRDRLCSPTWAREVAAVSVALTRTSAFGLYHATAHGETTWADFARRCAALLGLPEDRVSGVPAEALPMKAPRPRRAILDNVKLRALGLDSFSSWQDALAAFMAAER